MKRLRGRPRPPGQSRAADRATLTRVARLYTPYRRLLVFVFLLVILAAGVDLVIPLLTRVLFDDAIGKQQLHLLFAIVAAMIGAALCRVAISIVQTYLNATVGQRTLRDVRADLYHHLQAMPLSFFTSVRAGEIQSRLSNDINGVESVLTDTFTAFVRNLSTAVSIVVAMLILSPALTLISLCFLPLTYLVSSVMGKLVRRVTKERQERLASLSALIGETLSVSGALLVKTFGRQELMHDRFTAENHTIAELSVRRQMLALWAFTFGTLTAGVSLALVYLAAGLQIIGNPAPPLTVGTIIAFTTLMSRLIGWGSPISQLFSIRVDLQGALALFDRIFAYLDLPVAITDAPDAIDLDDTQFRGEIVFRDVSFTYPRDEPPPEDETDSPDAADTQSPARHPALSRVSFTAAPGQLVAIVGRSGAGKTTLISLVSRLYDADAGTIALDGHPIRDIRLASLSRFIGVVSQETYLFHASVRENLLFARPTATDAEMMAAARAAAIHDRIMELDDHYDTVVGERGYKLSGGEKQRMAIARAVLKDPRILVLDEATSALDTGAEIAIHGALESLMRGRTTLAIAHRLSTILAADVILVLDRGALVEHGSHHDLLRRGGLYAQLYHEQFAERESPLRKNSTSRPSPPCG